MSRGQPVRRGRDAVLTRLGEYGAAARARMRPVWHRLAPAVRTVTPIGRALLVVCVVAWIAAWQLGWLEMAVVAAACLLLLVVAALFMLGRADLTVSTVVEPPRVTVGDPLTGELVVRNTARAPLMSTSLEFPIGTGGVVYDLPLLLPGREHTEMFVVPTQRRGVIEVGPVSTVRGDPLGLFRRVQEWTDRTEVFVHPRVVALEPFGTGLIRDLEGTTAQNVSMSDLAFHALREYTPGDDLRHVHWRSSARHGQLLVRQFLDTRRSHLVVVVDGQPAAYQSEQEYETALAVAASLLRRGLLDEYDVSFLSGDTVTFHGVGRAALDGCSRAAPSAHGLVAVAGRAAQLATDASLVVLVTGPHTDYVTLQRAAGHFGVDAARAAVLVDGTAEPALRTTGDVPVLTLAELSQLALMLRWGLR